MVFNLSRLGFLLNKKVLASSVAVAGGGAMCAYFLLREKEEKKSIPEQVAATKAKMERSRPNYSQLLQNINSKGPDNIPEGLRAAYEYKNDPIMAERWAGLFCEEGQYDINENNYKDYQEYCYAD